MIKYETIISNYDDKITLYNWLRKVEEALKNASATNFVVNKKGNATLSFSITFADGTTLESGDIVLQQGESVDQARIASGILQLHLTNGTWLTAGNVKPVSNFEIDANQHLIVNYADGTSQDLGAIFTGNVIISGSLQVDTFTATNANIFENIKDSNGHNRFIEGDIVMTAISGITPTYCRWSLSGSHLLIVLCFSVANGTALNYETLAPIDAPQWVKDKIYAVFGSVVIRGGQTLWATDYSSQTLNVTLEKVGTALRIVCSPLTLTADRNCRIQYDLLIDNQ